MRTKFTAFILPLCLFISIDSGNTAVTEAGISRVRLGKETGILDENIKVTIVDADDEGNPIYRQWTPSVSDIEEAENDYVGEESTAPFRIGKEEETNGAFDEKPKFFSEEGYRFRKKDIENDFIDIKRNLTYSKKCDKNARVKAVIELVLVCDKEFGDYFKHDYKEILNYFVVYMWDVNMRYKSVPSNDVSFQVNEIMVINSKDAQPFVENARTSVGTKIVKMLNLFAKWVYQEKDKLPAHDLIALVTNSPKDCTNKDECANGVAFVKGTCINVNDDHKESWRAAALYDRGYWGSVSTAAHEFAHSLGVYHDFDKDNINCTEKGFIMDYNRKPDLVYFFSSCSDRMISDFVRSDQASCLKTLSSNKPRLDPSFDGVKAPSIEVQCIRATNKSDAEVTPLEELRPDACAKWCTNWEFFPIDNSECKGKDEGAHRCFRSVCRPEPQFFRNVGSGLCIQVSNPFSHAAPFLMVECPKPGTPLDKVFVQHGNSGAMLLSPFQKGTEVGERCGFPGDKEGDTIKTDRCDVNNKQQGWDFKEIGNGKQFLLKHRVSGRCAKPENNNAGSLIGTYGACNSKDNNFKWERV